MQECDTFMVSRRATVLLCLLLAATFARAAVIFDSGLVTFAPTGTQFGRISRDGVASDWSGPKPFPGVTGAPTTRGYELMTVNSGPFPFLQISLDDPAAALFDAAYITAYTPVNSAPNYGLNVNYLGDPGLTRAIRQPKLFPDCPRAQHQRPDSHQRNNPRGRHWANV
jgi:hypothetical protein